MGPGMPAHQVSSSFSYATSAPGLLDVRGLVAVLVTGGGDRDVGGDAVDAGRGVGGRLGPLIDMLVVGVVDAATDLGDVPEGVAPDPGLLQLRRQLVHLLAVALAPLGERRQRLGLDMKTGHTATFCLEMITIREAVRTASRLPSAAGWPRRWSAHR